jgi:hypothetical protein
MSHVEVVEAVNAARPTHVGSTERKDRWWIGPLLTGLGLGTFVVYSTCRALHNGHYHVGPGTGFLENHSYLLSPFYSPLWPHFLLPASLAWISPAFLVLWAPGGFRVTCYYYRKAYYRSFFLDPAGCGVGEPSRFCGFKRGLAYKGETRLLLFQNLHRYFLYFALIFLVLLAKDVVHACTWPNPAGHGSSFGISIGTLVLAATTTLLTLYTFSCHSLRHLVGGRLNCFSSSPIAQARSRLWSWVTVLNKKHMLWAWASLFMVGFADFYVWMVASDRISDPKILF